MADKKQMDGEVYYPSEEIVAQARLHASAHVGFDDLVLGLLTMSWRFAHG